MSSTRSIGREIGTAFAVLAIYLLTVLAPLHHARASQFGFEQLGYATIETGWVLCTPTGTDGGDGDALVAKCPATGIGKADFVLPVLDALPVVHVAAVGESVPATTPVTRPQLAASPSGPRAPPVQV